MIRPVLIILLWAARDTLLKPPSFLYEDLEQAQEESERHIDRVALPPTARSAIIATQVLNEEATFA